jgi:hypothetical protein
MKHDLVQFQTSGCVTFRPVTQILHFSEASTKRKYYSANASLNKINKLKQHSIINTKLYNQTKNSNPTSFLSATPHSVTTTTTAKISTKPFGYTNPYRSVGSSVSIDNRPKQLVVDNIENHEEKVLVLKHLKVNEKQNKKLESFGSET